MRETIDAAVANEEEAYKPPPEFAEDAKESLVPINLTDSTELWLIQWPNNQHPDFDGNELLLELHHNGQLGNFEDSSGKVYDVVSFESQEPDATVFLPSTSEPKIVGKISRRVSLLHYPDPKEYEKINSNSLRELYQNSTVTSLTNSYRHFATPTRSSKKSMQGHQASTHSSRPKSSLSEFSEPSKSSKRRRAHGTPGAGSTDRSTLDSGRGHSAATISGSSEHSHHSSGKSKKKIKSDE